MQLSNCGKAAMASYQLVTNAEEGVVEEGLIGMSESVLLVQSEEQGGDLPHTFSSSTIYHDTVSSSMASAGIGDDMMVGDSMIVETIDGGTITTSVESASHLTSGDLEALVSFQAELDRIGSEIPETHDPGAQVEISVANFDPEESAAADAMDTEISNVYEEGVVIESTEYDSGVIGSYEESGGSTFNVADSQIVCGGDVLHDVVVESSILPDIGPDMTETVHAVEDGTIIGEHPIVVSMAPSTVTADRKPLYLIPRSSSVSSEGAGLVGQVLYTTASGSGTPVSVDTSQLITRALMDAKALPSSMHGKFLAVTSTSGGSGGPIIAKVVMGNNSGTGPTGTQTMTFAPCSAVGPGGQQTVRLVTSSAGGLSATGTTSIGGRTYTLATPHSLMSPGKTRFVTTMPTTPNKQIMVSKIALGQQKTPTKITMIPVSMGKSPQKIAPAPGVASAVRPSRVIVVTSGLSAVSTSSILTTAPKVGTIVASPNKLIFRQATAQRPATPRKGTVAALTQQTVMSGAANHVVVTAAGTTVRMAVPVGSTAGGAIQVPGNKFPYIRLVTATTATNATVVAGNRQSLTTGVRTMALTPAPRPIMLTTTARSIAPVPTSAASQVRMAVPISVANSSSLIGQPMVAAKQMTVGGQQRIFIPASSVAQMRPSGVGGTSTITVPASALTHLGSSIFSTGSNIVMVPAQYMAQLQAQGLTTTVASTSLSTGPAIAPAPAKPAPLLLPAAPVPVAPSPSVTAPSTSLSTQDSSSGDFEKSLASSLGQQTSKQQASNGVPFDPNGLRPRKPCNCTKSQCLKLYCDCFANGEFCHDCNCNNCSNNLDHEEERQKAIKSCLERNPQAFHPKIGKTFQGRHKSGRTRDGDIERRHNKGCNCKRSGCLKNYCECYEAKIMCSHICKCVGCKNFAESAEKKTLMHLADAAEVRVQQQTAARSKLSTHMVEVQPYKPPVGSASGERLPSTFITSAVVEATCQCLLAQAEDGRDRNMSEADVERNVIQEFSRCLLQIIDYASKTKV